MLDKGQDARFYDGYSRWGIKGSNEISEGLSAVYRFEHKFSTEDAGQAGGRLAYVGLSGGFGSLTLGQIWSASYNHAGVIRDIGNYYSGPDTSLRIGNALSYAYSNDAFSVQFDAIMDGGKDTGKPIDQWELGATVNIGDIGRVAFAHVKKDDAKTGKKIVKVTRWYDTGLKQYLYSPKQWTKDSAKFKKDPKGAEYDEFKLGKEMTVYVQPVTVYVKKTDNTDYYDADNNQLKNKAADDVFGHPSINHLGDAEHNDINAVGVPFMYKNAKCPTPIKTEGEDATCAKTTAYYGRELHKGDGVAGITSLHTFYFAPGHVEDEMDYGEKSNHVSASFDLGAVTLGLGHSTMESMDPTKTKKAKTNYIGVSGGIGDTGLDWRAWYRTKEAYNADEMMEKSKPWGIGLGKDLGGGASAYVEHWNDGAKGAKKSGTVVGLRVDF